jgi:hypothetical protein
MANEELEAGTPSPQEVPSPDSAFNDLLGDIKDGDRQKYSNVETALKSINPAQEQIKTLNEENERLKEQVSKSTQFDQILQKLGEKSQSQEHQPQPTSTFDDSKLDEILDNKLSQRQQQLIADQNVATVMKSFKDKFGDKAESVYNQMAADNGIGGDTLRDLASKSPLAVLRLAGLDQPTKQSVPSATTQTHRTEPLNHQDAPSSRIKMVGASSNDMVTAWRNTEALVNQN